MATYHDTPFADFTSFMEQAVVPRQRELGTAKRLDGWESGSDWDVFGFFGHQGTVWAVHADSHFAPLQIAYDEVRRAGGRDPFVSGSTRTMTSLDLRPDLRATYPQRFKHLYIYEVPSAGRTPSA